MSAQPGAGGRIGAAARAGRQRPPRSNQAATLALGGITGIQIYEQAGQLYIAEIENSNVENGAGALGYFQRINTADAASDAKLNTLLALVAIVPQIPELSKALGQVGKIKIIRRGRR